MICEGCIADLIIIILGGVPLNGKLSQILCEVRGHVIYIDKMILDIAFRDRCLARMQSSVLCTQSMSRHFFGEVCPPFMHIFMLHSVQVD